MYRGIWRGACVAVKVLDTWVHGPPGAAVLAPPLEALLSRSFPHPHIVQVYAFSIRAEQVGGAHAGAGMPRWRFKGLRVQRKRSNAWWF